MQSSGDWLHRFLWARLPQYGTIRQPRKSNYAANILYSVHNYFSVVNVLSHIVGAVLIYYINTLHNDSVRLLRMCTTCAVNHFADYEDWYLMWILAHAPVGTPSFFRSSMSGDTGGGKSDDGSGRDNQDCGIVQQSERQPNSLRGSPTVWEAAQQSERQSNSLRGNLTVWEAT